MSISNSRAWTDFRFEGRILLVDDASDNRRILSYFLARAGADVVMAEDGRRALEIFDAENALGGAFDAVVTDMEMPELDGFELASLLRMRGATIPVVACTASTSAAVIERCFAAGCSAYVAKPVIASDLMQTVAAALAANPATLSLAGTR